MLLSSSTSLPPAHSTCYPGMPPCSHSHAARPGTSVEPKVTHARGRGSRTAPRGWGDTHLACRGRRRQKHQQERQQQRGRPGRRPRAHGGSPLSAPACPVTRRLCGHRVPCATRVGEPGCDARLASPPGAGFVGLSQAVRPSLPTEVFDCGSKGGKKWLRSRPRSPPLQLTRQCPSDLGIVPSRRENTVRCGTGGRRSRVRGWEMMLPRSWGLGGAGGRGSEVGNLGVCAGEAAERGGGSGQRPCPD